MRGNKWCDLRSGRRGSPFVIDLALRLPTDQHLTEPSWNVYASHLPIIASIQRHQGIRRLVSYGGSGVVD